MGVFESLHLFVRPFEAGISESTCWSKGSKNSVVAQKCGNGFLGMFALNSFAFSHVHGIVVVCQALGSSI